jgi:protein-S-isoprenylcysteine O-methyltransferase Ste14
MSILPFTVVRCIWAVFGIFWLLAAFIQKRTVRRQSVGSRVSQLAIILLALTPFFVIDRRFEILYRHVTPDSRVIQYLGILLLLIGCGFAVWARVTLGGNWSGMVTVKENHALITHGPYAWVRHPIYTGILLALVGTALALGTLVTMLEVPLIALALWLKLRTEEKLMFETFGEQYMEYRQQVKALVPYVI